MASALLGVPRRPRENPPRPALNDSLLRLSRITASGSRLPDALNAICQLVLEQADGALGASIILVTGKRGRYRIAGIHGIPRSYLSMLRGCRSKLRHGHGPSGLALALGHTVVIEDVAYDPRMTDWREIIRHCGFQSSATIPLDVSGQVLGTITLYRALPGPWNPAELSRLERFADHIACAVQAVLLADTSARQITSLRREVRQLQARTHEHSNRLHALHGLIALGEFAEAEALLRGLKQEARTRESLLEQIRVPAVAGLLLAHIVEATQRGSTLQVDPHSTLDAIPAGLSEARMLTLVANLVMNALEAVSEMPRSRRIVRVALRTTSAATTIEVRDWGTGIRRPSQLVAPGRSRKKGHLGVGLSLVQEILFSVSGTLSVTSHEEGATVIACIPHG